MAALDRQRLLRLIPYLGRDRRRLLLTLTLLIPVAGAAAVQPLLVGQAISALRHEPVLPWLQGMAVGAQLRTLVRQESRRLVPVELTRKLVPTVTRLSA